MTQFHLEKGLSSPTTALPQSWGEHANLPVQWGLITALLGQSLGWPKSFNLATWEHLPFNQVQAIAKPAAISVVETCTHTGGQP